VDVIIVVVRTKDEALNIGRFCTVYRDCVDLILVADGGSEDDTIAIAKCFKNTKVRQFTERIEYPGGIWRNPHGKHMNFMFDWAVEEGADWIIFDDCDCVPTIALQQNLRDIMANAAYPSLFLYRMYVWGSDEYFPRMNDPGKSIYAWKPETGIVACEKDPIIHRLLNMPSETERVILEPPFCCLHYFSPNEEIIKAKMNFYRITRGETSTASHPLQFGGELEDLPEWAHE